ncbi:translation factor SUI1-like protein [Cryptotermes secundus]|uniref:Eukaryotic translation initiation factor eIF1 n=2 Tax=Termitoidae TaxID=1912919 RepID=A0A2J7PN59_9NEOP|nr:translation factor SUI1-like protein [Cryptotermes secundus]
MIKSRRMRWAGHVARMGEMRNAYRILVGKPEGKSHREDQGVDPFADAIKGSDDDVQDGLVHIRIQQRNGRKTLTTVQGLSSEYDLKKIVRACKKEFACNGTVIEHPEYGEVLQLQGDQRENICQWLTKAGLAKPEQLKVHGF